MSGFRMTIALAEARQRYAYHSNILRLRRLNLAPKNIIAQAEADVIRAINELWHAQQSSIRLSTETLDEVQFGRVVHKRPEDQDAHD